MDSGKPVWTISFLLVLFSSPMVVFDLIGIQHSVEVASGADVWYDSQLASDLLNLRVAVGDIENDPPFEVLDEVRLRLDNVFNRLNSLPEPGNSAWHTQGISREDGLADVRVQIGIVDQELKLLDRDPRAFRILADRELQRAISTQRLISIRVHDRQNTLVGRMQSQVSAFKIKLLGYGISFVALVLLLAWLMLRHMHSETVLMRSNGQLLDMTDSLVLARDSALRSSEAKSNFLANVSHELRTPLNAILGFSEALMTGIFGRLGERQAEYTGDIHNAGRRLLALINDILDLAKLEVGKLELREEAVDLVVVTAEAVRDLRETARSAGVTIRLDAPAGSFSVMGDRLRLRQVLDNLLSNAVKFTPAHGLIVAAVERRADGGTAILVTDTGIGIPANDLARVFLAFEQSDSRLARPAQGTGLGLPLVRQLVECHGGTVELSSELGAGTRVVVELPSQRSLPEEEDAAIPKLQTSSTL